MKKLYYSYIGNRIVYFDYYIDNTRIKLSKIAFLDLCFECAISEWLKTNNITDTDIEVCPATYNPNEKLLLLIKNYKYGVYFRLSFDNQIVNESFMTGSPSVDEAIKCHCKQYGLEQETIKIQETTEDLLNLDDFISSLS